jgi:hypothetical protein
MWTTFPAHKNFLISRRWVYFFVCSVLGHFFFCYSVLYLYVVLVTLRDVTHLLKDPSDLTTCYPILTPEIYMYIYTHTHTAVYLSFGSTPYGYTSIHASGTKAPPPGLFWHAFEVSMSQPTHVALGRNANYSTASEQRNTLTQAAGYVGYLSKQNMAHCQFLPHDKARQ